MNTMPSLAPSDTMKVFSESVRRQMEIQGVSIAELARRTSMSRPGLTNLLNGRSGSCTFATADAIAVALNTTTAELLHSGV